MSQVRELKKLHVVVGARFGQANARRDSGSYSGQRHLTLPTTFCQHFDRFGGI